MHQFIKHIELLRDTIPDESEYPFSIPAVAGLTRLEFHERVTFLVGENGSGKSTFLEAIAIKAGFNAEGGTKNFTGSNRPSESVLSEHLRLARGARREKGGFFLRAETMFNVFTEAEQYDLDGVSCHEMSHGEAFLWVMMNRFRRDGLYLLDEPEAALSPQRQLSCLARIHALASKGSQFIIATHSPILMACPDARIVLLEASGLREVAYEETEHYQVTTAFLQNPRRMLTELLGEAGQLELEA